MNLQLQQTRDSVDFDDEKDVSRAILTMTIVHEYLQQSPGEHKKVSFKDDETACLHFMEMYLSGECSGNFRITPETEKA